MTWPRGAPPINRYRGAIGVSTAFGTFGELLQGALPEPDGDFLVTLPIARWSTAMFHTDPDGDGVQVHPPAKQKSLALAETMLAATGPVGGGTLVLDSTLPEGKGMASSSADLVATARAVGNALGMNLTSRAIEDYLRQVEPTDGLMYPGIVAFHHRVVRLRAHLGSLPSMTIVGIDEGGTVDTVEFNRTRKPFSSAVKHEYARLLNALSTAVAARDLRQVGAVATRSAVMNQELQPKRMLDHLLHICTDVAGLGVCVAHSGTVLGIMLDTHDPDHLTKLAETVQACSELLMPVSLCRTLSFD